MSLFEHRPHPHLAARATAGPVRTADQHATHSAVARFNARLAVAITNRVGSMWTAYLFAGLALASLPAILVQAGFVSPGTFPRWLISASLIALVAWVAQTFLQLVLLPVIIVGQNVQAAASDARSQATYDDATALLHYADTAAQQRAALAATLARIEAAVTPKPGA